MVKSADNTARNVSFPFSSHIGGRVSGASAAAPIAEITTAMTRLHRDLDACHPNNPSLAYALAAETHAAIRQKWSQYPQEAQAALLLAFLKEIAELQNQLQVRMTRLVPANGYMFGLQDEAMKLEAQTEILQEESSRAEADLQALLAGNDARDGALQ